jgi:hypothetical protein
MMRLLWTSVLLFSVSHALDVEIVSTTCDESLPVTAELWLRCNNSPQCTFGKQANVHGTCTSSVGHLISSEEHFLV